MGQLGRKKHKVRTGFVAKMLRPASLYLIRPILPVTAVIYWTRKKSASRKNSTCAHDGQDHEFAITDPHFESRYGGLRRLKGMPPADIQLPCDQSLHLCLSLTPDFHGAHYKNCGDHLEAPPP